MRAVVLAGGRGSRMGRPEKCLLPVGAVPLLLRVAAALIWAGFDEVVVATTRGHPGVAWLAETWGFAVDYTEGLGYGPDLVRLAERHAPALFASCDLANLTPSHVKPLLSRPRMATAVASGQYVGLTWMPSPNMSKWEEVEVPPLMNINTWRDYEEAEADPPPAYPLPMDPHTLRPHEDVFPDVVAGEAPIAVEAWTCTVLDGHHRLNKAKREGRPILALPVDYRAVEVNMTKMEVLARAAAGLLYPPKTTWHTYRGIHISQIPTAQLPHMPTRLLKCDAI